MSVVRLAVRTAADSPGFDGRPLGNLFGWPSRTMKRCGDGVPEIGLGVDRQMDLEKRAGATAFPRRLVVLLGSWRL